MGKDPSAVVLATALALCALCPFFARCDETELDIKKGIESLSKILVKYQAEFDNKVKFAQLQEAVDEIDKAMLGYMGKAKDKLPRIRSLNSKARLTYRNCVGPVFEWCISVNSTFNMFIGYIGDSNLSETNRNIIWSMTALTLELGLYNTGKSLELLTNVQYKTAQLKNAFEEMLHDVLDDFGPGGFYGEEKAELERRINNQLAVLGITRFVGFLFGAIGALVFGPLGVLLGLPTAFTAFGITDLVQWKEKQTYEERIKIIEHFFKDLTQKIEKATDIVKDMESALDEDKTNLHKLRGHIEGANMKKGILLSDMAFLRLQFIPDIKDLKDSCAKYVNWHGFDAPFYHENSSRTRRAASTFCESQRSTAKHMLAESGSSNSTESQELDLIIDQMDCGGFIPPNSVEHHGFQKWRANYKYRTEVL